MKKDKGLVIIRKSNQLVEAKYKLDIWETRVFTKMLSMIRVDDVDFKEYRIYLSDMIKEFSLSKGTAYQLLREAAESLNDRTVNYLRDTDEGVKKFKTKIVAGVDSFVEDENDALYIDLSFHPKMKPLLLELKSRFTTYDIRNVLKLPSTYSIRLYELLKQYQKIGKRSFELTELKEMVGAVEKKEAGKKIEVKDYYPLYGNFKQKVIQKAQKDLKKFTDISFQFEPIKKGRKVTGITFYIAPNKPERDHKQSPQDSKKKDELFTQMWERMKDWEDMTEASLKNCIEKYSENQVQSAYITTKDNYEGNPGKIGSRGKYFYHLVTVPTLFDDVQEKQEKVDRKRKVNEEYEKREQQIADKRKELEAEKRTKEDQIILQLLQDNPKLDTEAEEAVLRKPLFQGRDRDTIVSSPFFQPAKRTYILGKYSNHFEKINKHYDELFKTIKR